jgi:putative ABC transport system permease protein
VGVVNEILHDGPNSPAEPELYLPLHQAPPSVASIVVRSGAPLEATERMLRSLIAEMDPDQAVARVRTMDETLATWLSRQRELTNLVMAFALAALTLAALGIYSVVAYTVSLRTREFGIRLALGGGARRVLVEAMAGGARLVLLGLAVGLVVAVALARTAGSLLADVRPNDPLVLLLALALLGLIGALATFVPARRATRVDPVTSLKSD